MNLIHLEKIGPLVHNESSLFHLEDRVAGTVKKGKARSRYGRVGSSLDHWSRLAVSSFNSSYSSCSKTWGANSPNAAVADRISPSSANASAIRLAPSTLGSFGFKCFS